MVSSELYYCWNNHFFFSSLTWRHFKVCLHWLIFQMLPKWNLWDNITPFWCISLFIYCLILLDKILFIVFASILMEYEGYWSVLFFLVIYLPCFYERMVVVGPIEPVKKFKCFVLRHSVMPNSIAHGFTKNQIWLNDKAQSISFKFWGKVCIKLILFLPYIFGRIYQWSYLGLEFSLWEVFSLQVQFS